MLQCSNQRDKIVGTRKEIKGHVDSQNKRDKVKGLMIYLLLITEAKSQR